MAIDIISREFQTPIIVGDQAEMKVYQRCAVETDGDMNILVLSDNKEAEPGNPDDLRCNISAETAKNLSMSEYVLLVGLNESDALTHAVQTPVNDFISPFRYLDDDEVKELAETLVQGDFRLDYLR